MEVEEILIEVRKLSKKGLPSSGDRRLQGIVKESQRKIGSWRKTLWLAGVLRNERESQLPRLAFTVNDGRVRLDHSSVPGSLFRKYSQREEAA